MKDILIVEDGKKERDRLVQLFKGAGYTLVDCETVGDAELAIQSQSFRLAILDIGLSDRSGSHLFDTLKRSGKAFHLIIFTGNPSVHLKQRFIDGGASDYVVKGSPMAQNDSFLGRVKEIIGEPQKVVAEGIDLEEFLTKYVPKTSRALFLNMDNSYPACQKCGGIKYMVTFDQQTQLPPEVKGLTVCSSCGTPMDPEIK